MNPIDELQTKIQQQADEIARLRSVCREAAERLDNVVFPMMERGSVARGVATGIICDLAAAGKEATDGQ